MKKEELVELVSNLRCEDKHGQMEAIVYDVNGGRFITDSIRLDMDGGRLIISQLNSPSYETNKQNWKQELEFARK
jgi:hypothetical protein